MKRGVPELRDGLHGRYPGLFAPASLKRRPRRLLAAASPALSGAFCSGLIEARRLRKGDPRPRSYPGLFAPASLKPDDGPDLAQDVRTLSGAFCSGLIEALEASMSYPAATSLSGAFCSGLIEAPANARRRRTRSRGYPGLFAPASLKRSQFQHTGRTRNRYPGLFAPASLKRTPSNIDDPDPIGVIRGFLLRPH